MKTTSNQFYLLSVPHHIRFGNASQLRFSGLIRKFKDNESIKKVYNANIKFFQCYVHILAQKLVDNPI